MKRDLSEVASRERSLADAVEKLAKELFESKQSAKVAATDMDAMRSQVDALQENLRSKDDQLEKLKASLQHGSQVRPCGHSALLCALRAGRVLPRMK